MSKVTTKIYTLARRRPVVFSVALLATVVACFELFLLAIAYLVSAMSGCNPNPSEPCDGVGLMALSIISIGNSAILLLLSIAVIIAMVLGIVAALVYFIGNANLRKPQEPFGS
jgi:hypothetical protein